MSYLDQLCLNWLAVLSIIIQYSIKTGFSYAKN